MCVGICVRSGWGVEDSGRGVGVREEVAGYIRGTSPGESRHAATESQRATFHISAISGICCCCLCELTVRMNSVYVAGERQTHCGVCD